MDLTSPAEIFGVDGIVVLIVVVLVLFGSTKIPKLAHSLGSAQKEFKKGLEEGASPDGTDDKPVLQIVPPAPEGAPAPTTGAVDPATGSAGTT